MLGLFVAIFDTSFSPNLLNIIIIIVAVGISSSMIFFGLREINENGVEIKSSIQQIKIIKLVPMVLGFILMALGISFMVIAQPTIYQNGTPTGFFWHPLGTQGLLLFWLGEGIQLIEVYWYNHSTASTFVEVKKPSL